MMSVDRVTRDDRIRIESSVRGDDLDVHGWKRIHQEAVNEKGLTFVDDTRDRFNVILIESVLSFWHIAFDTERNAYVIV